MKPKAFHGRVRIRSTLELEDLGREISRKLFKGVPMEACVGADEFPAVMLPTEPFGLHICLERRESVFVFMVDSIEGGGTSEHEHVEAFGEFLEHRMREAGFDAERMRPGEWE